MSLLGDVLVDEDVEVVVASVVGAELVDGRGSAISLLPLEQAETRRAAAAIRAQRLRGRASPAGWLAGGAR